MGRINAFPEKTTLDPDDRFVVDGSSGTKSISPENVKSSFTKDIVTKESDGTVPQLNGKMSQMLIADGDTISWKNLDVNSNRFSPPNTGWFVILESEKPMQNETFVVPLYIYSNGGSGYDQCTVYTRMSTASLKVNHETDDITPVEKLRVIKNTETGKCLIALKLLKQYGEKEVKYYALSDEFVKPQQILEIEETLGDDYNLLLEYTFGSSDSQDSQWLIHPIGFEFTEHLQSEDLLFSDVNGGKFQELIVRYGPSVSGEMVGGGDVVIPKTNSMKDMCVPIYYIDGSSNGFLSISVKTTLIKVQFIGQSGLSRGIKVEFYYR